MYQNNYTTSTNLWGRSMGGDKTKGKGTGGLGK